MIQHPAIAGNNGEDQFFLQQSDSNTQYENSNMRSRNPDTYVYKGTSRIFYKTRMCQKFIEGNCPNGRACNFAHGLKDLREPPPNWQEIVKENRGGVSGCGGGNWNDDQKIIHRMRICRKFYNGDECPYGEKCNFLHESPAKFKAEAAMETGRTRESSVINIKTVVDHGQSEGGHGLRSNMDAVQVSTMSTDPDALRASSVKGTYWKTRICSKWETTGQCIFADKCHFAHGLAELHMPVGRMEGEGHHYAVGSIAANMLHCPTAESPPADPAIVAPVPQGEVKGFGKWKLAHKKLNRIYGDWIDDENDELSVVD